MQWKAIMKDGEHVWENPQRSTEQLDRPNVVSFQIVDGGVIKHHLDLEKNQKLIYRRRRFLNGDQIEGEVIIVGWHINQEYFSLVYLFEDGHTEHAGTRGNLELTPIEI